MKKIAISFFPTCFLFVLTLCFSFTQYQQLFTLGEIVIHKNDTEKKTLLLDSAAFDPFNSSEVYYSWQLENRTCPISTVLLFNENTTTESDYESQFLNNTRQVYLSLYRHEAYIVPINELNTLTTFNLFFQEHVLLLVNIITLLGVIVLGIILFIYIVKHNLTQKDINNAYKNQYSSLKKLKSYEDGFFVRNQKNIKNIAFIACFTTFGWTLLTIFTTMIAIGKSTEDFHINYHKYEEKSIHLDIFDIHTRYRRSNNTKQFLGYCGKCYSIELNNLKTPIIVFNTKQNINSQQDYKVWYRKDANLAYLAVTGEKLEPVYLAFIHELMKVWWMFLSIPLLYLSIKLLKV